MIDHLPVGLLLVGSFITKRNASEERVEWKPTHADAQKLAEDMQKFSRTKVGHRWWYPFELACREKGVITNDDYGKFVVRAPEAWIQLNKTKGLLDWEEKRDMELLFQSHPEERIAHEERLEAIRKECRAILTGMNYQTS